MTAIFEGLTAPQAPPWLGASEGEQVALLLKPSEMPAYRPACEALAKEALEPNAFYEPWMLLPALETLADETLRFLLIFVPDAQQPENTLVLGGVFPLTLNWRWRWLPIGTGRLWKHPHCYLCVPLVHARHGEQVVEAFLDCMGSSPCSLFELPTIAAKGAFARLLAEQLRQRRWPSLAFNEHARPMLGQRRDVETFLRKTLRTSRRKNILRRQRQLAAKGRLEYDLLTPTGDVSAWIQEFLTLEASGWKGKAGSALACRRQDLAFFTSAAQQAFARGRLLMLALRLDGRAVAMRTIFLAGSGAFCFKPAYDEAYARFSPGILLSAHLIRHLHQHPEIAWLDSCSAPGNTPLGELTSERRDIQSVLFSTGGILGNLAVRSLRGLRHLSRRLRRKGDPS